MEPLDAFREGKLQEAIEACTARVKAKPSDPSRDLLSQLLCFAGQLERADSHLGVLGSQMPEAEKQVSLMRQLVRAAKAREEFFEKGRMPEFLAEPPEHLKKALVAALRIREGNVAEAKQMLDEVEETRPAVPGKCDGVAFDDIRDTDDLTCCFLEVLTTSGKYYWIPFERILYVRFEQVQAPIDVLWRPARINAQDGLNGVAYIPQLYYGSHASDDEQIQLGRETQWSGEEDEPARGVGHRIICFQAEDGQLHTKPFVETVELGFYQYDDPPAPDGTEGEAEEEAPGQEASE